ncbi:MAG: molybdate ABC transporter substrate-binding protein [Phaeodactylibacter sp.]|uniref:molybdate ABC transporter substrate-binding protein n=1 Tax=Phaeodactylibacter sp. TaxID=1940289 RepID=UPI0032EC2BE7
MMKCIKYFLCWGVAALLSACGSPAGESAKGETQSEPPVKITVATAANLQFAMEELVQEFEDQTQIKAETVVSSSGKLTAQILEGAPYDLLVSANMKYPNYLIEQNEAAGGVKVYAYGTLVAWSLSKTNLEVSPEYLLGDDVVKVAIANPRNAPYGEQAIRYFEHYGVLDEVEPKLVYGESIAQTNQYIISKAVDVGLTAKSVVLSPEMKGKGYWLELPGDSYSPIEQGVVITRYGSTHHSKESLTFFTFLFSEAARAIFEKYGYNLPEQASTQ